MVRSYLRHEPTQAFGVICSNSARSILDADGKTAFVPALEDVLVWDVKRGEMVSSVILPSLSRLLRGGKLNVSLSTS